jgi:hypothetical protein
MLLVRCVQLKSSLSAVSFDRASCPTTDVTSRCAASIGQRRRQSPSNGAGRVAPFYIALHADEARYAVVDKVQIFRWLLELGSKSCRLRPEMQVMNLDMGACNS